MSQTVILELPDAEYQAIKRAADATGTTPEEWIVVRLPTLLPKRDERLRRHFGSVDMGQPVGIDNDQIDADLAREYGGDLHDAGKS